MEEKIMHLLITEDDMALAQGLQRALQEKNRQVLCCKTYRRPDSICTRTRQIC